MAVDFSIIVPVKEINDYLRSEIIPALRKQTDQNFELIIVPDRYRKKEKLPSFVKVFPSWPDLGPGDKRDLGVKKSKGRAVFFLDDDAYPDKDWLKNAAGYLGREDVAAVCGPGVTPANDPLLAKVSGWVWASYLGSGGAGTYRCWPGKKREVDDYPTFNLMVKKKDFEAVGGFDSDFWPGEDTKLCHDLVYKLKKKIIYDPKILVYHHRRKILRSHLKQIGRYGIHRGYFVKVLPKTSRKIGYFLPSLFTLGVFSGPVVYLLLRVLGLSLLADLAIWFYSFSLAVYFIWATGTAFWVWIKSRSLLTALLFLPTVFISHLFYGLMFLKGLAKKAVKSKYSRELV